MSAILGSFCVQNKLYSRITVLVVVILKLKCHQYHAVNTTNVSSIERSNSDPSGAELSGHDNKINLVTSFIVRGMPRLDN